MSSKKIALIGAGQIGGSLALLASQRNLGEIILLDNFEGTAIGKSLDLAQMSSLSNNDACFKGSNNYQDIKDADVCIITAGFARKDGMSREDLLLKNIEVIKQVAEGIKTYAPKAFVIMVTNPLDVMVYIFHKLSGFDNNKVVGMAGVLDSARFRTFIAEEIGVSKKDVNALVLGGHGDDMVPLTRFCTVAGIHLDELVEMGLLSKDRLNYIIERTRKGGGEIVKHLANGSAFYAPALSAIEMCESYLFNQKRLLPCAAYLDGQYGIKNLFIGVPVIIGQNGVEKIIELRLDEQEKKSFERSVNSVKNVVAQAESMI
jgi:malate dehydrogenase